MYLSAKLSAEKFYYFPSLKLFNQMMKDNHTDLLNFYSQFRLMKLSILNL